MTLRCLLLPGTLLPPEFLGRLALPEEVRGETLDWMTEVVPCDLENSARALRERIGDDPAIVVGHSSGAAIAAACAVAHPTAFVGLVLINSGPHMNRHRSVQGMLERMRTAADHEMWTEFAHANVSADCPVEDIAAMVAYSERVGADQACEILGTQAQTDLSLATSVSGFPVEVVHGSDDAKRSPQDAEEWLAVFPDAHVTIVPDASHTPFIDQPEVVAEAISRILTHHAASATRASATSQGA